MGYVEQTLTGGEKIMYKGRVSLMSMWFSILLGIITSFLGVGILILFYDLIVYFCSEMAITDKRVVAKFGFISRVSVEVKLANIESISFTQSIMGRIFNYGDISLSSVGNTTLIPNVSNPLNFRKQVLEIQASLHS